MERAGIHQRRHPVRGEGGEVYISVCRVCGGLLLFAFQLALQLIGPDPV